MKHGKSIAIYMIGIISISYYIFLGRFSGIVGFHMIWLFLGLVIVGCKYFKINLLEKYKDINGIIKGILSFIISIGIISFVIIEGLIIYSGCSKPTCKKDYVIVLGAAVHGDYMSLILKERVDTSLQYLKQYPHTKVIVSGGKGPGESITEAEAMKRYLVENGIKEDRIIKEEKSRSTSENFKYSFEILKEVSNKTNPSVCLVTTNFHMFRAKFLAKRAGINVCELPAKGHIATAPNYYIREYFAVIHSFICDNPQ